MLEKKNCFHLINQYDSEYAWEECFFLTEHTKFKFFLITKG